MYNVLFSLYTVSQNQALEKRESKFNSVQSNISFGAYVYAIQAMSI